MPVSKRVFDIAVSAMLLTWAAPVILFCAVLIAVIDRHPPFFRAQRMKTPETPFLMWKLRTMRGCDDGLPTGGHKALRTTRLGRVLRHWHVDELPQLWNVLIGDMSLVGPRPPTARAVSQAAERFAAVLHMRPGITGLATVTLGQEERRILATATTADELEQMYLTRVLPCKLRIEDHYRKTWSPGLDLWILASTCRVILCPSPPERLEFRENRVGIEAGFPPTPATILSTDP